MLDIWQSNYKRFDEANGQLRREIEQLELDRQKIFDMQRSGIYSNDEFLEQKRIVNEKIREKEQFVNQDRCDEFDMDEALTYCFQFVRASAKTWKRLPYASKMRFQNNVFAEKPRFDGKEIWKHQIA